MSQLTSATRQALRTDVAQFSPVIGLITAAPVVTVFALGLAGGDVRAAISMAIGANLIAVASLVGAPRIPVSLALADAVGMSLSTMVGCATSSSAPLHIALLVLWCFGAGLLTTFGLTQATVGTQYIVAFVVLGRFSATPRDAFALGLWVLAGSLVEVLALLLLRLPPSLRVQRWGVAAALEAVADQAGRSPRRPTADVVTSLDDAERLLDTPSLFGRTDVQVLRATLDQVRRCRLELTTLAGLRVRVLAIGENELENRVSEVLDVVTELVTSFAVALRHPRRELTFETAQTRFTTAVDHVAALVAHTEGDVALLGEQCVVHLRALGGQLRAARALVEEARTSSGWRLSRPTMGSRAERSPDVRRFDVRALGKEFTLSSPVLRHAIRLAVAVPVSLVIAHSVGLPRSYWVPFAVVTILKPDYGSLLRRGVGRVVGTLLGATLAAVLVSTLHPSVQVTVVLVGVLGFMAYSTWQVSFAVAIGFVTSMVLVILSTSLTDSIGTAADRFIDIALGGTLALLAYVAWPSPTRPRVDETVADMFRTCATYLDATFKYLWRLERVSRDDLAAASRGARTSWARAQAAVGAAIAEPRADVELIDRDRSLLAVGLRIVRAIHAVRLESERTDVDATPASLRALEDALVTALGNVARMSEGADHQDDVRLRALYQRCEADGVSASLLVHVDELVNAINTAEFLLRAEVPSAEPTI